MIKNMFADIPRDWSDISKKILEDAKNLPKEMIDTAKHMKEIADEIHNIRSDLHSLNSFKDKMMETYYGFIEFFNTPLDQLLDAISLPFAYILATVGVILLMVGCHRWGSKLFKIGTIGFLIARVVIIIVQVVV